MADRGSGPLALLRRAAHFRLLILATFQSALGTYLAALALTVHVYDETGSGRWVGALLIADFLPIVLIGLTLGPLVDRLSRRRLMIAADIARTAVFALLPFVDEPAAIVALAGAAGVATGFFRPAVPAALPNLVRDADLGAANAAFQTVENVAWMAGPLAAGGLLAVSGPDAAYWLNAVTFLVSAALIARIPERLLQSEKPISRGHWRDLGDGFAVVRGTPALVVVLLVWNVVMLGNASFNVAEVVFAKDSLGSGDLGFAVLVAASGVGLTIGGLAAGRLIDGFGAARAYALSLAVWALFVALAAVAPSLAVAAVLVVPALAGNAVAVVANITIVQRSVQDAVRGRVFTLLMSTTYATLGVSMAVAGPVVDALGGRAVWGIAAGAYAAAAALALVLGPRVGAAVQPEEDLAAARTAAAPLPSSLASSERAG